MARKQQHPHIGKYLALYEYREHDDDESMRPTVFDTPEDALAARAIGDGLVDGDVVYVYAVVGVKVVRKPTLTENLVP